MLPINLRALGFDIDEVKTHVWLVEIDVLWMGWKSINQKESIYLVIHDQHSPPLC